MNRVVRGLVSVAVAGALAAGSAVAATQILHDRRAEAVAAQAAPLAPEVRTDRVRNALAGLADDGIYVAPDARDLLDERGERAVAQAIAEAETPIKVIVWTRTNKAGASYFDQRQQVEAGLTESGGRGVYLIWQGPEDGDVDTYGAYGFVDVAPYEDFTGDPARTLPRLVAQVDAEVRWYERRRDDDSDYWGGTGGGIAAGLLIGSGVLLAVALLYGLLMVAVGRRLPGRWLW